MDKDRKAALKAAYRQTRSLAGVMGLRNLQNGKVLVEGSADVQALINRYRSSLRFIGCRNAALQEDWTAFGPEAFAFEVLESFEPGADDSKEDVLAMVRELEDAWVEKLQPFDEKGYNKRGESNRFRY
ncbi:GIY-YIG nuclease family protein [bacterium]|nr:GIY-YIG nuclease family protein [bacterium]